MTIYDLKPAFQNLLRPIVKSLFKIGLTPNQITTATFLFSLCYSYCIYTFGGWYLLLTPLFFFLRMALNAIDGILAKEFNLKTTTGVILNEVTDIIADIVLYMSFISHLEYLENVLILFCFLVFLSEFIGLSAFSVNKPRNYAGPLGKSDRAFIFSIIALTLYFYPSFESFNYIIYLMIILIILTSINRFVKIISAKN